MKETPRKDDDSSKDGKHGNLLLRSPKVEEALKAWQKIPSALESVAREVNQETRQIPKEMSKAVQRAKTAVSSAANKGKTVIKKASWHGTSDSSARSADSSQQDNGDSLVIQPKNDTDRHSIPTTVPSPHPSPHPSPSLVDFQNSAFILTSSILVVAVGATFAQYDSLANVPWNLVLPWLLAAVTMGYASGYHHRSRLQELELKNQKRKSQHVDEVIRNAHFRLTMTGKYHPPASPKPVHKSSSVIRRMFKPILKTQQWFHRRDLMEYVADEPISELTMEKEKQERPSLFLQISLPVENVKTLDEYTTTLSGTIQNLGMDVFFNGGEPKSNVSTHPALMANLRREAPLLIINGMTHIANIILYFKLPDWFTSWTDIEDRTTTENDDASKNDKPSDMERTILRDFLLGDDEYRDERLFIVPHLVDAPLVVKAITPPKAEILVKNPSIPCCWHKSEGRGKENGEMFPALEWELDLIASRAIRSVVGLVARHLHRISVDVACVIYDKDLQKSTCFTCFCIEHIDMMSCPSFPEAVGDDGVLTNSLANNEGRGQ